MAVFNPIAITYGDFTVGGLSSSYQLDGPYAIEKSFTSLQLVFQVLVVAAGSSTLQAAAEALEDAYQKRDQDLTISMGGASWAYESGSEILNVTATAAKTGNRETDRGASRAYTVTVTGELPAGDRDGLRDLEVHVDYSPARQRVVTMRGTYTAFDGTKATAQYLAEFDAEAATLLTGVGSGLTFEKVDENHTADRNDHLCQFMRQYVQLVAPQSGSTLDDPAIVDHRVQFTDLSQHPGDGRQGVYRLRRVSANFECSVAVDAGSIRTTFESKVKPLLLSQFQATFSPVTFGVEDLRVSADETARRLSVSMQFVYQKSGGDAVVEVTQSVGYREARTIDYTPIHGGDEFAAEADVGWAVRERVWTRTTYVIGSETPKRRLGERASNGPAGEWGTIAGESGIDQADGTVQKEGWNIVANTSQATPIWVGDPETGQQIAMTVLSENVVERWHKKPSGNQGPITQGGS